MAERGRRSRHLSAANFRDGACQRVLLLKMADVIAIGKAIDRALDGAQGFAAARGRLGANDLVAQIAHALRQTVQRRLWLLDAGIAILYLVKQGHKFAAQCLPLAWLRVTCRIGHILKRVRAGHKWYL